MRVVVQRVIKGGVVIEAMGYSAKIAQGFVILLGVKQGDTLDDVRFLADKCANLRVFEDAAGKMNLSILDIFGDVLIISQFTLYGDAGKGNRPSFIMAARPEEAIALYESFIARMQELLGEDKVKVGIFGAMMEVEIINDGPVTIIIDNKQK